MEHTSGNDQGSFGDVPALIAGYGPKGSKGAKHVFYTSARLLFRSAPIGAIVCIIAAAGGRASAAVPYFNGFESNTTDWSPEVARVTSGTSGIPAASGSFFGLLDPSAGAFSRWDGYNYGAGNGVPTAFIEYTTSVDIYLNLEGGWGNDTRFDFSSAINSSATGLFRRDFIFNGGFYNDADGSPGSGTNRFIFSASNNSQPGSAFAKNPARGPIAISTTGWYTFEHHFYENALGDLAVDLSIFDSSNALVNTWLLTDSTDDIALVGGNRYGWFDFNQFSGLGIDNASLTTIPAPSAAALLGLAGGVLASRRRRESQ